MLGIASIQLEPDIMRCVAVLAACLLLTGCTEREIQQSVVTVKESSVTDSENGTEAISDRDQPIKTDMQKTSDTQPDESPAETELVSREHILGDAHIRLSKAARGIVPLRDSFGDSKSKEELLMVHVEIENQSASRKLSYKSWRGDYAIWRDHVAALEDEHGNMYKRVHFGLTTHPIGGVSEESIYPGKLLSDVLIFELPVDAAKRFTLTLPGEAVGQRNQILQFRFGKDVIDAGTKELLSANIWKMEESLKRREIEREVERITGELTEVTKKRPENVKLITAVLRKLVDEWEAKSEQDIMQAHAWMLTKIKGKSPYDILYEDVPRVDVGITKTVPTDIELSNRVKAEERKTLERKTENAAKKIEDAKWKTWTSSGHSVKAKFVSQIGKQITLEKEDGTKIKIAIDKLSQDDADFIHGKKWLLANEEKEN